MKTVRHRCCEDMGSTGAVSKWLRYSSGFVCLRVAEAGTAIWAVMLLLFLSGLGRSMQLTALTTLGYADLPPAQMSSGSTLASMVTQLNTGLGVAVAAVTLRLSSWFHGRPGGQPVGQDFSMAFCCPWGAGGYESG